MGLLGESSVKQAVCERICFPPKKSAPGNRGRDANAERKCLTLKAARSSGVRLQRGLSDSPLNIQSVGVPLIITLACFSRGQVVLMRSHILIIFCRVPNYPFPPPPPPPRSGGAERVQSAVLLTRAGLCLHARVPL